MDNPRGCDLESARKDSNASSYERESDGGIDTNKYRMVFVVNCDLGMDIGKTASQVLNLTSKQEPAVMSATVGAFIGTMALDASTGEVSQAVLPESFSGASRYYKLFRSINLNLALLHSAPHSPFHNCTNPINSSLVVGDGKKSTTLPLSLCRLGWH
uniref:Uncharacterized protein n=1 Tax=Timema bartmani TaxID=61472 RepID=A0A7R9F9J1_9NEOP|nr:unnamed protein product [Timema bartmani]